MPIGLSRSRLTRSTGFNQLLGDQSTMTDDNTSGKYKAKKKESIPLRVAGVLM